jgi:hypothetical protein
MAKVFRFHEGTALKDWQNSSPLNETNINAIKDPEGATAKKQITSIPSPFARIDIVRTAFKTICSSKELEGKTIFHKMVSDAFDVGQLFFDYEKHSEKISIIAWDSKTDLTNLLNSTNSAHKILGETIRLYLEQDADVYNFDDLKRIFLINYKQGPKPINIIGGTSPASLFFTSANNLEYTALQSGNDKFFDNEFCPLYKRDKEFIKFIFALKNQIPDFSSKFSFVNEYLDLSFSKLDLEFRDQLSHENLDSWYKNLRILNIDDSHNAVEIIGLPLKMKANSTVLIEETSDFCIAPTANNYSGLKPLVLPNDIFSEKLTYTTDVWDLNYKSPYYDKNQINERRLPNVNDKYPYLTISDLLEPVLIRTILPINNNFFFDGNIDKPENGYLLPIKPLFFNFFTVDDLSKNHRDGSKFFELKLLSNKAIECILRIPIKNEKYIIFKRTYNNPVNLNSIPSFNELNNIGIILENLFTVGLFPFVKYPQNVQPDYRVALYEADYVSIFEQNKYSISFYKDDNSKIENIQNSLKRIKAEDAVSSNTYILKENFNYLQVANDFGKGIFIPLFKSNSGTSQFSFAIDFGTSNTHIEYRVSQGTPKPFEIDNSEIQFAKTHKFDENSLSKANNPILKYLLDFMNQDFVPEIIGKDFEFSFPTRSAVLHRHNLDFSKPTFSFADVSIPLTYEKYKYSKNLKAITNLKWSANTLENEKIINHYFEKLLLLIRTKILLNNGSLDSSKIIWFFPSSMSLHQQNSLEEKWSSNVSKYLGGNAKVFKVCESLAPFYYYTSEIGLTPALTKPVVSIDLGGGTTDVVIYENNKPNLLTSFKFAGNTIFGDNYGRNFAINGFVNKYYNRFIDLLQNNDCNEEKDALMQIKENGNSVDIINALFRLQSNHKLTSQNKHFNFIDDLKRDNDFKIIFLVFYGAIIYHIAKIMKNTGLKSPSDITFSGTASKLITILDSSNSTATFSKFINHIFSIFFEDSNIKVILPSNPKELTCKGGLYMDTNNLVDPDEIKTIFSGEKILSKESIISYSEVDESFILKTQEEFLCFIKDVYNINNKISFNDLFGINSDLVDFSKEYISQNFENSLRRGLLEKELELGSSFKTDKIAETLSFYPLTGVLSGLAFELYNKFGHHENEN